LIVPFDLIEQTVADMTEAFSWLPKSVYAAEANPLEELERLKGERGSLANFVVYYPRPL